MKKFLNPKRIRIITGIAFILLFGIILDFVSPVSSPEHSYKKENYNNELKIISSLIKEYYQAEGKLPETLFGGDRNGWYISGKKQIDPIISSGLTDAYPEIKQDSTAVRQAFAHYKIMHPDSRSMLGHDGNRMGNIKWMDTTSIKTYPLDKCVNPLAGNFYYERFDHPYRGFALFIMGDSFRNSYDILDSKKEVNTENLQDEPYGDGIPDGFISGVVVHVYDNGSWLPEYYFKQ